VKSNQHEESNGKRRIHSKRQEYGAETSLVTRRNDQSKTSLNIKFSRQLDVWLFSIDAETRHCKSSSDCSKVRPRALRAFTTRFTYLLTYLHMLPVTVIGQ